MAIHVIKQNIQIVAMKVFFATLLSCFVAIGADAATLNKPLNQLGLVAHWTFDGGDMLQNVRDRSGNGNHGNLYGQISTSTVLGKVGQALSFDGVDDYVDIGSFGDSQLSDKVSVSAWVYRKTGPIYYASLVSDELYGSGQGYYLGDTTGGGDSPYSFRINGGTGNSYQATESNSTFNQWVHYVGVFDGDYLYLYKNGGLVGSVNHVSSSINIDSGSADIGNGVKGNIDDVRIYNRALSANEVKSIYNSASAKFSTSQTPTGLKNGLVGHWTFDGKDMISNVMDVSGQGNHGNLQGQTSTTSLIGKIGQALSFDGADDYVEVSSNSAFAITDDIGISAWIKRSSLGTNDIVVAKTNGAVWDWEFGLLFSNELAFYVDSPGTITVYSAGTITDTNWHHIAVVRSGSNLSFYKDGVRTDTQTLSGAFNNNSVPIILGHDLYPGAQFNGIIDDVRVYNRALTETEITQLYAVGAGTKMSAPAPVTRTGLTSGLVGHWTFDGKDMEPNVRDRSGQGNHGTISGQTPVTTVIGKMGQALLLDGVNDSVDVAENSGMPLYSATSPYSVAFWFKNIGSANTEQTIYHEYGGTAQRFIIQTRGYVAIFFPPDATPGSINSNSGDVTDNEWHHLVWTDHAGGAKLYIDGVQDSADFTYTPGSGATANLMFGETGGGGYGYWDGAIDEVRGYNRILSATEVKQLYNMGR